MRWAVGIVVALLAPAALGATEDVVAGLMEDLLARAPHAAPVGRTPTSLDAADVGYGLRTENYPCYVATVVNVFAVSTNGVPRDAIALDAPIVLAPEETSPCGSGEPGFVGEQGLTILPDPYDWTACMAFEGPFGGWANIASNCHVADFTHATLRGRIGFTDLRDCSGNVCVTLQQVFAGTNNAPPPLYPDVGVIAIS